jgi:hypothetical protein
MLRPSNRLIYTPMSGRPYFVYRTRGINSCLPLLLGVTNPTVFDGVLLGTLSARDNRDRSRQRTAGVRQRPTS